MSKNSNRASTVRATVVAVAFVMSGSAIAQTRSLVYGNELEKQTMTLYLQGDTQMATFDSETAGSKETKAVQTYSLGGWVGEDRLVGMILSSSEAEVPFALNSSKLNVAQRDIKMKARFAFLYPTIAATLSEISVEKDGAKEVDLYASGYGVGLEAQFPLHRIVVISAEAMSYAQPTVYAKTGQDVKVGSRKEGNANLSFDLTQHALDLLVGYKYSTYSLNVNEVESQEKAQGAYLGLRLGLYF